MKRQEVLDLVQANKDDLEKFAVQDLFLFGSVARDEATITSDVDFLVNFSRPVGLFTLLGLKGFLEELLGCDVDIGTPNSLRSHLKETVFNEAIHVI